MTVVDSVPVSQSKLLISECWHLKDLDVRSIFHDFISIRKPEEYCMSLTITNQNELWWTMTLNVMDSYILF